MDSYGLMAGIYAIQGLSAWSSSRSNANAQRALGEYQLQQNETNARLSKMQAEDALKRGDLHAGVARRRGAAVKGAQRVNAAAQGIDINTGSAAAIQAETEQMSDLDVANAKNNAWREAWGYQVQADQYSGRGRMAKISGDYQAKQTVLTGNLEAAGYLMRSGYSLGKSEEFQKLFAKTDTATDKGEKTGGTNSVKDPSGKAGEPKVDPKTGMGWFPDEGKDGQPGFYGSGPRGTGHRSRENPLYPGHTLTDSWFIKYDGDEGF